MAIVAKVEHITPELAEKYMRFNTNNYRKLKRSIVKLYADEIKNGRWELNGETISFDENGVLKDGQHRLAGIIVAGKPIDTLVVRGIKPEVTMIDMSSGRTRLDIARANNIDCDSTVLAAANIIVNQFSGRKGGSDVIEYVKAHVDELNRAMRLTCYGSGTGYRSKNAPSVAAAYLMIRTNSLPSYEVELFFRLMNDHGCTHADGYEVSPALIAQRMFDERGPRRSGVQIQKERLEILVTAMLDFHKGKKREMKYKIAEPFNYSMYMKAVRKEDGLEA